MGTLLQDSSTLQPSILIHNSRLKSNAEFALIFEDDISFDHKILRSTVELLKDNPSLWDVVTFEISHGGTPLTLKHLNETKNNLSIYLTEISHTGAYLINRKAARKLLQKSLPIKMPIDHYFTRSWEFGLKFTGIEPRIAYQAYGDSNINGTKRYSPDKYNKTLLASLQRGVFKLQSYLIRFFYNLKIYIQLQQ
jgi:glycosyl transferase family 25